MRNTRSFAQWLMLCMCLATSLAFAANQESIVVDSNGDYVFTYQGYLGWQKVTWVPATKINPAVRGIVTSVTGKPDALSYSYILHNGKDSRQFLVGLRHSASNVLSPDTRNPDGWTGGAVLDHAAGAGFIVGWFYRRYNGPWESGLKPGTAVSGFGFDSKDLPGVGMVAMGGAVPPGRSFPDEGPNEDSPILGEFNRILDNDFVTRLAAVPRISVLSPYDAATVLTNIQKHLDQDLVAMKLVEPALVAELDNWLEAAIAAAKSGNSAALRADLKEARKLLKRERQDMDKDEDGDRDGDGKEKKSKPRVDKLAARVLDFDLEYVEKRVKGDKER